MTAYQSRRRTTDNSLEQRVTAVETAVEHIEASMGEIKTSINSGFADLHERISDHNTDSRPNIVAWAGWAAVVLIVIGMLGSGYVRDLNRIELTQSSEHNLFHEHEHASGIQMARHAEKLIALEREVFPHELNLKVE